MLQLIDIKEQDSFEWLIPFNFKIVLYFKTI